MNPEKQKENFNNKKEPKNLGKEVKKIIQNNLKKENAYYSKNNKNKYCNRTFIGTYPDLSNNYSISIPKEKNLDKNISQKVTDKLGKDAYYLNYQKNSIQSNINRKNNEERYIDNSKIEDQ